MNYNYLRRELEKFMQEELAKELVYEFEKTRLSSWLGDATKTLTHAGKFCEVCIAFLKKESNPNSTINLNSINFDRFFNQIINVEKDDEKKEMLYLLIPRILQAIYTIRSKKRAVHIKMTNAELIDSELVVTSCNWIMTQLIMIYTTLSVDKAIDLTNSIMEKKLPTIETFEDGSMMILKKELKFREQLLLILYKFQNRLSRNELFEIMKPKKKNYVSVYLNILSEEKLIHLNREGAIINKNGIKEIEQNQKKYLSQD